MALLPRRTTGQGEPGREERPAGAGRSSKGRGGVRALNFSMGGSGPGLDEVADLRTGLTSLCVELRGQVTGSGRQALLEGHDGGFDALDHVLDPGVHFVHGLGHVRADLAQPGFDLTAGVRQLRQPLQQLLALYLGLLKADDTEADGDVAGVLGHGGEVLGSGREVGGEIWHRHLLVMVGMGGSGQLVTDTSVYAVINDCKHPRGDRRAWWWGPQAAQERTIQVRRGAELEAFPEPPTGPIASAP